MNQRSHKEYLLNLLLVILAFNYVDRLALGIVLEDVKTDLNLTDTQLGFLTGIAFALFYAIMGLPIARWADRGNRVTIISLTAVVWSAAVALCSAATNFMQLLLIRVGVAVGEAGCQPPALSLIADHFTRAERPRAVSRYLQGWPLALVAGNLAAGWINELYGWRATFLILGLPGVVLAGLAYCSLREPRCSSVPEAMIGPVTMPAAEPKLTTVLSILWANAAYRHVLFCVSVLSFFTYGIMQWQPAFFVRSHELQTGELGSWFAFVYGVGGFFGTWLGGELASRFASNNERLQLMAIAIEFCIFALVTAGVYLSPNHYLAFVLLGVSAIGGAATNGPLFAITQTLVPARMRAMSIALVLFSSNLIGMGFGSLAVGALSDQLRPIFGGESLRYALLMFCPGYFWCAWHAWQASRTASDVAAAQLEDEGQWRAPVGATIAE